MNLKLALLWTIVAVAAVSLAGTAAAQQPAAADKPKQEAQAAPKQESAAPAAKAEPQAAAPDKGQPGEPIIESRKDKISYAFGVDLARDLKRQTESLNVDLLIRALTDALGDKNLLMTDEEVTATLKTAEAEQKHDLEHVKAMIAEKNRRAVEAFVAENAKKEGVVTLPSGLQYKILKQGDGKMPMLDDHVVCQYRGTLIDGTEFDSSYKHDKPSTFPVKGVMPGWAQALQLMPVGSKWQIFIPPQLAYGEKVVTGIGSNAMLIFEVELISILDKPQTVSAR
jgi:FKBP-type peptidyl-prolyl cis-trans isomerase